MRHGRSTSAPNPKLQEALGCLDLRLEDELTRYRRQRAGLSVAPIVLRPKQPAKKPLDLMSFGGTATVEAPTVTESPKAISFDLGVSAVSDFNVAIEESAMIPYESEGEAISEERTTPPDDYLESSEHLLQSLKREEAKVEVERGFLQSLSTPFGIGSMLTLLVSSGMLGYVIMNPSIVAGLWQRTASEETAETSDSTVSGSMEKSPRLDRDEFSELGLDSLSVYSTKPAPIPSLTPSPTPAPTPAAPAAIVAPTPSVSPSPSIAPTAPPVTGSSVMLPPVTLTQSPQPAGYVYKVETTFTGDQSLEAARKIAPDAFVRSDGKIQLAATNTQAEAQKKAQEFKNRGIAAEVR